ncbi:hypothetical protein QLQ12_09130 [Actinoplanes sp. NEAU-A12]|uniref:Uncharacterized protein n=1 Tax=Actinoplanes sandaracinus TaxID=3045177 RepID=A0ABT6WGA6_9ACTN|nr:hypothetical protein [Actinoplanes sandaracinus]MDI6098760.1 hypothetical protein [Actinoplanes sandaracinus]
MRSPKRRMTPAALLLAMATACGAPTERDVAQPQPSNAQPSSAPTPRCSDPLNDDDGHCALELKDSHLRTPAPAIGEDEALDEAGAAVANRGRDGGCLEELDGNGHCLGEARLAATDDYVTKVRQALARAGYTGAVVRLGRVEDPTARGALIWAVRIGDVCVIADVTPPPVERQHSWYAGLLPDGRCLAA